MLGKLLKYELMAEWKKYAAIYAGMAVLAGTVRIMDKSLTSLGDNRFITVMSSLCLMAFIFLSMLAFGLIFVFSTVRFYKNMYRDEGYLMHTLPVSPWSHIFAKLIPVYIWTILSAAVFFLCTGIAAGGFEWVKELPKIYDEFIKAFSMGAEQAAAVKFLKYMLICTIASPLLMQIYLNFCISFGSLFNSHKILMAIVAFIGVNVISQTISSIVLIAAGMKTTSVGFMNMTDAEVMTEFFGIFDVMYVFTGIFAVVLYGLMLYFTYYIMHKHLNLE